MGLTIFFLHYVCYILRDASPLYFQCFPMAPLIPPHTWPPSSIPLRLVVRTDMVRVLVGGHWLHLKGDAVVLVVRVRIGLL